MKTHSTSLVYQYVVSFMFVLQCTARYYDIGPGSPCGRPYGSGRWMIVDDQLLCEKCAVNQYWEKKERGCMSCTGIFTNSKSNTRTSCKDPRIPTQMNVITSLLANASATVSSTTASDVENAMSTRSAGNLTINSVPTVRETPAEENTTTVRHLHLTEDDNVSSLVASSSKHLGSVTLTQVQNIDDVGLRDATIIAQSPRKKKRKKGSRHRKSKSAKMKKKKKRRKKGKKKKRNRVVGKRRRQKIRSKTVLPSIAISED